MAAPVPDGSAAQPDSRLAAIAPTIARNLQSNDKFRTIHQAQDEIAGRIAAVFHLSPADTKFTNADGVAVFGSADGRTQFLTEVFGGKQDSPVLWMVRPTVVLGPLLAGGRVNVFMRSSGTYIPNLDIELYHYGLSNKLFMYINLVPRRSLLLHPDDIRRFHLEPAPAGGRSFHDMYLELEKDPTLWQRFSTKDAYMRALTSTGLMYEAAAEAENLAAIIAMAHQVTDIWLALAQDDALPRPQGPAEQEALEQTDAELRNYARRDPQNPQAAAVLGQAEFDKMLDLLTRDPRIFGSCDTHANGSNENGHSNGKGG